MSARDFGLLLAFAAGGAAAQGSLVGAARNDDHATAVALLAERADPNQAEADGTTPLLDRRQTASGRSQRQHRRDDLQAFEPQHLFDEIRRLADIGAPTRWRDGHVSVGDDDVGTDLRQPFLGGARRVDHTPDRTLDHWWRVEVST